MARRHSIVSARLQLGYRSVWQVSEAGDIPHFSSCKLCGRPSANSLQHYCLEYGKSTLHLTRLKPSSSPLRQDSVNWDQHAILLEGDGHRPPMITVRPTTSTFLQTGDLKSQRLCLIVQRLESHHQDLQRLSKNYCIIGKNKISDPGFAEGCSTITLIYNFAQYPVHTSVEK
ncbi:hypothetical protein GWK47_028768 [Chionoecetes opilio]|uniref:Uncharacterized protein n=1 Tax=Chionoecetes opilio TaxID=41210 RepID=A0A8J4YXA1_CHIOP|nr:hypothetical protein GWK47_028768 [Chionoecetes opilio]